MMRFWILVLAFFLLLPACAGASKEPKPTETATPTPTATATPTPTATPYIQTIAEALDDPTNPLLVHPDELNVYIEGDVSDRDMELTNIALTMARPLFDEYGLPFTANVYIAATKSEYVALIQQLFGSSITEARNYANTTRGISHQRLGIIIMNVEGHDHFSAELRDTAFIYALVHEFYHILQAKISGGWTVRTNQPNFFTEKSANMGAERAFIRARCVAQNKDKDPTTTCNKTVLRERLFDQLTARYIAAGGDGNPNAFDMYIVDTYGADAYDRFYERMGALAQELSAGANALETARTQLGLGAFQDIFGVASLDELLQAAQEYIEEHEDRILKEFKEKYPNFQYNTPAEDTESSP